MNFKKLILQISQISPLNCFFLLWFFVAAIFILAGIIFSFSNKKYSHSWSVRTASIGTDLIEVAIIPVLIGLTLNHSKFSWDDFGTLSSFVGIYFYGLILENTSYTEESKKEITTKNILLTFSIAFILAVAYMGLGVAFASGIFSYLFKF